MTALSIRLGRILVLACGLLGLGLFALPGTVPAAAQDQNLRLSAHRDWGFSLGRQMQGRFTFTVSGPPDLASATLWMDGQQLATADGAPFQFPINTGDYAQGQHEFYATARTAGGQTLRSNTETAEFVGTARAWQATQGIMIPLIIGVLLVVALAAGGSAWLTRRAQQRGQPLVYSAAGGALCPKCGRPFPLSLLGMNLPTGKLARCPHCGKWSVVRRARPQVLAAAVAAEAEGSRPQVREMSPEEKLRQQVEESRYR